MLVRAVAALLLAASATSALAQGKELFGARCAVCHGAEGRGVAGLYPPLAHRLGRLVENPLGRAYLVRVVAFGLFGAIEADDRPYNGFMPGQVDLADAEIAAVLNYVLTALNKDELPEEFAPLTPAEVAGFRSQRATPSGMLKHRQALMNALRAQSQRGAVVPKFAGVLEDYARECQGCHRADGMGAPGAVPRLKDFVGHFTRLPEGRQFLIRVPGVASAHLDDARLAALLNWMLGHFSRAQVAPDFRPYTPTEVGQARRDPLINVMATREALIVKLRQRGIIGKSEDGIRDGAAQ